jgi:small subunit ribosomal protein S20
MVRAAHTGPPRALAKDPTGKLGAPMANIKSQIKRNKQNETRRERNKAVRTSLKTSTKKARVAATEGDADAALERAREAARALDKAAAKGIVHKRTAARQKSRLTRAANAAAAG